MADTESVTLKECVIQDYGAAAVTSKRASAGDYVTYEDEESEFEASSSSKDDQPMVYVDTDNTVDAMRQCEKFILTPYANALKIIGWLPYHSSRSGYIWQVVLVIMWSIGILATMVIQVLTCYKRDAFVQIMTDNVNGNETRIIRCEEHIISGLILTNVLILATYFYGIYLFVKGEADYLFGLASCVFIKNSQAQSSSKRLIQTIGVFFILGIVWLLFSLIVRVMAAVSVELFEKDVSIVWPHIMLSGSRKIVLLLIALIGFFTFDMVYIFAIMNYVTQAEMNVYLLWDIRKLIETKKYDNIDGAIKDTRKCKEYLDILNGKTAALTGLSLFVLGQLGVTAIIGLLDVEDTEQSVSGQFKALAVISSILKVACWCSLVALPLVQAARVTHWCDQLKDLGPEIRGRVSVSYVNTSLLDLDSLFSFLHHVKLRASIFAVPISPRLLYLTLTVSSFTVLILLQHLNTHQYI